MSDHVQAVPPAETTRWPGAGRAAALFVGVPLAAALVLAATPLSEPPPMPPAVSALPTSAPARVPVPMAVPVPAVAPGIVTASRSVRPAPSRAGIAAHAAGRPLAPPSIVTVAPGVDRVELQSP
jgi:hypothetical protein